MLTQHICLKGRRLQYFAFCAGGLNMISCGFHLAWPSPYLPQLLDESSTIPTTNGEGSWVAVFLLFGGIFGASLGAAFLDRLGRKKLILAATVPIFTSWLMIGYASTVWELCFARFVAGLSQGLSFCALPLYFAEMSDAKIRGIFGTGLTVVYYFGVLLQNVIGTVLTIRQMAFVGVGVPVLTFMLISVLPDTPHFYLIQGQVEMARKSLEAFSGQTDVSERLESIMCSLRKVPKKSKWVQMYESKKCQRALVVTLVLRTIQAWSGAAAFTFYLPAIFKDGEEFVSTSTSIVLFYVLQTVFTILLMVIVDEIGRKPLMIFSVAVVTVTLMVVGVYFAIRDLTNIEVTHLAWIPFAGMLLFIIGSSLGLTGIPLLLIGELFPIGVKSLAVCILDVEYCIVSTLASKYFQYTKDELGLYVPFLTFALLCTGGIPFVVFCVTETKNKTLEEINSGVSTKPN